ncbi:MAG: HAD-IB family hydrolase [Caulobacteraceae bacterium]|nr:HAD-IB family hydrolase [Caulobacteraceae bacterium]
MLDRQSLATFRPLVAFDFDGTLTCRDSFLAFLAWRAGARRYAAGLARLLPAAARFLSDSDRSRLKAACVKEFLAGTPLTQLEAEAQGFATERAPSLLRPDALAVWRRWQGRSARLVIVTASPEPLVAPFARGLGAERLIGTRLAVDPEGRLTGALVGPNCRGPEKARRLREAFGEAVRLEAAYGDSAGDTEMLALAEEQGMKVFGGGGR